MFQVLKRLRDECGIDLRCVEAASVFYDGLAGVEDPEDKRKIIGRLFCEVVLYFFGCDLCCRYEAVISVVCAICEGVRGGVQETGQSGLFAAGSG